MSLSPGGDLFCFLVVNIDVKPNGIEICKICTNMNHYFDAKSNDMWYFLVKNN